MRGERLDFSLPLSLLTSHFSLPTSHFPLPTSHFSLLELGMSPLCPLYFLSRCILLRIVHFSVRGHTSCWRWEVRGWILVSPSHFSLLTSHFPLLTSHFSFLTSHFPLLTSHFSLLTSHFPLPTSRIGNVPFVPVVLFITLHTICLCPVLSEPCSL